jgi:hypothetical protein
MDLPELRTSSENITPEFEKRREWARDPFDRPEQRTARAVPRT